MTATATDAGQLAIDEIKTACTNLDERHGGDPLAALAEFFGPEAREAVAGRFTRDLGLIPGGIFMAGLTAGMELVRARQEGSDE